MRILREHTLHQCGKLTRCTQQQNENYVSELLYERSTRISTGLMAWSPTVPSLKEGVRQMRYDVIFCATANLSCCITVEADNADSAAELAERMEKDWVIGDVINPEVTDVLEDGKPKRKNKK